MAFALNKVTINLATRSMHTTSRLLAIFAAVLYCGNFTFESGICPGGGGTSVMEGDRDVPLDRV